MILFDSLSAITQNTEIQPTIIFSPQSTPQLPSKKPMRTYTHLQYNFYFMYPLDWQVETDNPYPSSIMVFDPASMQIESDNGGSALKIATESISFTFYENITGVPQRVEELYPQSYRYNILRLIG